MLGFTMAMHSFVNRVGAFFGFEIFSVSARVALPNQQYLAQNEIS
jgi:hypothetical protein